MFFDLYFYLFECHDRRHIFLPNWKMQDSSSENYGVVLQFNYIVVTCTNPRIVLNATYDTGTNPKFNPN